jgi:hypothetical protein
MSNNPDPTQNNQVSGPSQTQLQTIVVHRAQLTAENLTQLGQANYNILDDPNLFIFGRYITPQENNLIALPTPNQDNIQSPDEQDTSPDNT